MNVVDLAVNMCGPFHLSGGAPLPPCVRFTADYFDMQQTEIIFRFQYLELRFHSRVPRLVGSAINVCMQVRLRVGL